MTCPGEAFDTLQTPVQAKLCGAVLASAWGLFFEPEGADTSVLVSRCDAVKALICLSVEQLNKCSAPYELLLSQLEKTSFGRRR